VLRIVSLRYDWRPVTLSEGEPPGVGDRCLAVGCPRRRSHVATAAGLAAVGWFDPAAPGGRLESTRGKPARVGKDATVVALRFAADLSEGAGIGSPVFDARGACIGMVAHEDAARPGAERVLVRPAALLRPFLEAVGAAAHFDPPDLGVLLGPAPAEPGRSADLPDDLRRAREKAPGGAIVERVLAEGPASGVLWEGDVVLAVDGRPVFGDVPESLALAFLPLLVEVPADVTVLRGGRPREVGVTPRRAGELWGDGQVAHDRRASARR
jgi:hypothetical protein